MRTLTIAAALAALVLPCLAQVPAGELLDDLDRLAYDARSAGMGGTALAVDGLISAPVSNAATLGVSGDYRLGVAGTAWSPQAGALNAPGIFTAADVGRIRRPSSFDSLWGWSQKLGGRPVQAELTLYNGFGEGSWRLFGTKGAVGSATLTSATDSTGDHLTIQGVGTEYETLGAAYGKELWHDIWLGITVREARFYRAAINFRADRASDGSITVDDTPNLINRGLEWEADISAYHRASHSVAWGAAIRHVTSPRFTDTRRGATWSFGPSLDLGVAYRKPGSRSLYAADIRNVFGSNGGRPILKLGYERDLSHEGRWRARAGLNDGRLTLGIGWSAPDGGVDLAFGPDPTKQFAFGASFRF